MGHRPSCVPVVLRYTIYTIYLSTTRPSTGGAVKGAFTDTGLLKLPPRLDDGQHAASLQSLTRCTVW
eukprot:220298-Prymnesium_polylepis.1